MNIDKILELVEIFLTNYQENATMLFLDEVIRYPHLDDLREVVDLVEGLEYTITYCKQEGWIIYE